jgi:membrane protein implicated in regulation of membrane protease activity
LSAIGERGSTRRFILVSVYMFVVIATGVFAGYADGGGPIWLAVGLTLGLFAASAGLAWRSLKRWRRERDAD